MGRKKKEITNNKPKKHKDIKTALSTTTKTQDFELDFFNGPIDKAINFLLFLKKHYSSNAELCIKYLEDGSANLCIKYTSNDELRACIGRYDMVAKEYKSSSDDIFKTKVIEEYTDTIEEEKASIEQDPIKPPKAKRGRKPKTKV